MKQIFRLASLLMLALLLTACVGERVTIQTGEVGKQLTPGGLESDTRSPGSFRMDWCGPLSACPSLVRLQTSVAAETIEIDRVFLPKSNVPLEHVKFGIQFRIRPDQKSIDQAFHDIRSEAVNGQERVITSEQVFQTYIARKAPEAVIAALREYTVEQAMSESDVIAGYVKKHVNEVLKDTPVEVTEFGFPNGIGNPPDVVLEAKKRLYAVNENVARRVRELEGEMQVLTQQQAVARKRAENDAEIASHLGISVAQYQCLRTMDHFADSALAGTSIAHSGDCGLSGGAGAKPTTYVPWRVKPAEAATSTTGKEG